MGNIVISKDVLEITRRNPGTSSFRLKQIINSARMKSNARRGRNEKGAPKTAGVKLVSRTEIRRAMSRLHGVNESLRLNNQKHFR